MIYVFFSKSFRIFISASRSTLVYTRSTHLFHVENAHTLAQAITIIWISLTRHVPIRDIFFKHATLECLESTRRYGLLKYGGRLVTGLSVCLDARTRAHTWSTYVGHIDWKISVFIKLLVWYTRIKPTQISDLVEPQCIMVYYHCRRMIFFFFCIWSGFGLDRFSS